MRTITITHANGSSTHYKIINGTAYNTATPTAVCDILEQYRANNKRLRLYYGDTETGCDWMEEYDTAGTIGRSAGSIQIPLLIKTGRSYGGGPIIDSSIVKIKDQATGRILYQHPKYHQKAIEITASDMEGYTHNLTMDGKIYSRHKSLKSAQLLLKKLS